MLSWFAAIQRKMDILILWPECLRQARDLDHAKAAFTVHAYNDPAWRILGEDEIARRIGALNA